MQALTYASELCTENQMLRLKDHSDSNGSKGFSTSLCDIYLLYKEGDKPQFMKEARDMTTKFIADQRTSDDGGRIRRIAFLATQIAVNNELTFRCTHLACLLNRKPRET